MGTFCEKKFLKNFGHVIPGGPILANFSHFLEKWPNLKFWITPEMFNILTYVSNYIPRHFAKFYVNRSMYWNFIAIFHILCYMRLGYAYQYVITHQVMPEGRVDLINWLVPLMDKRLHWNTSIILTLGATSFFRKVSFFRKHKHYFLFQEKQTRLPFSGKFSFSGNTNI